MTADSPDERERGVLGDWNDERGFGFLTSASGESRVFVHISAFPRGRRPVAGSEVTYKQVRDKRNRARAVEVRYVATRRASRRALTGIPLALATASVFVALLVSLLLLGLVTVWLLAAYGLFSAVAFGMYRADKSAAVRGTWRTSESTLHVIALVGGWPGAMVARRVFRHKITKQPFVTVFWITVVINCGALAWLVHRSWVG